MNVCIVVDSATSAIGLSARSRHNASTEVIISAEDFPTCLGLVKAIKNSSATIVFFAWRGGLRNILQGRHSSKAFEHMIQGRTLGILIPDLLGLQPENIEDERKLLSYVDFYLVSSHELMERYLTVFRGSPPKGLYRDVPNVSAITEIRKTETSEVGVDVIWVGNSRWGIHYGMEDHKGFYGIVTPLMRRLEGKFTFTCIDSARLKVSHRKALELIHGSRILIQTSISEGTGLPLLEAAGLGTIVLTTEVGVARDFLKGRLSDLIIPRNIESFHSAITDVYKNNNELSRLLMNRFDEYVQEINRDSLPVDVIPKSKDSSLIICHITILNHLKWFRRWAIARKGNHGFDS